MQRMKWTRETENSDQRSECGRFIVRGFCINAEWSGYWCLYDTKTQTEHPCRTEQSAKSAARNILRHSII